MTLRRTKPSVVREPAFANPALAKCEYPGRTGLVHNRPGVGHGFGGIGCFNKEDSTRKGGTVQLRMSERIFEQNEDIEFAPGERTHPARLDMILRRSSAAACRPKSARRVRG